MKKKKKHKAFFSVAATYIQYMQRTIKMSEKKQRDPNSDSHTVTDVRAQTRGTNPGNKVRLFMSLWR